MPVRTLRDGLALAWGTLTAIPGPVPSRVDQPVARVAMTLGWLVALPVTVLAAASGWGLLLLGVPPLAAGLVVVGVLQFATRAIHADGLADTADGLGSGRPAEHALEIMRRGDVGPMGATALVLVFGLQASLLGDVLGRPGGWVYAALALATGRLALAQACAAPVGAARPDGLGAAVVGSVPAWLASAVSLVLLFGGLVLRDLLPLGGPPAFAVWAWPLGMTVALLATAGIVGMARRRLGGLTGDVLGALVELSALALLFGLVIG